MRPVGKLCLCQCVILTARFLTHHTSHVIHSLCCVCSYSPLIRPWLSEECLKSSHGRRTRLQHRKKTVTALTFPTRSPRVSQQNLMRRQTQRRIWPPRKVHIQHMHPHARTHTYRTRSDRDLCSPISIQVSQQPTPTVNLPNTHLPSCACTGLAVYCCFRLC